MKHGRYELFVGWGGVLRRGAGQWGQEQETVVPVLNMSLCGGGASPFGIQGVPGGRDKTSGECSLC